MKKDKYIDFIVDDVVSKTYATDLTVDGHFMGNVIQTPIESNPYKDDDRFRNFGDAIDYWRVPYHEFMGVKFGDGDIKVLMDDFCTKLERQYGLKDEELINEVVDRYSKHLWDMQKKPE